MTDVLDHPDCSASFLALDSFATWYVKALCKERQQGSYLPGLSGRLQSGLVEHIISANPPDSHSRKPI